MIPRSAGPWWQGEPLTDSLASFPVEGSPDSHRAPWELQFGSQGCVLPRFYQSSPIEDIPDLDVTGNSDLVGDKRSSL